MKLAGQMRLGRSSFKTSEGKANNGRKASSRGRDEEYAREPTFRYYDSRQVTDSRGDYEDRRDGEDSSSDGSLDEKITFVSETDLPVVQASSKKGKGWRTKKFKGFPIIATIKKKIRRKKNKQNERNMNHLEILPENDPIIAEKPEPTHWQMFMDAVAFPDKQLANLYSNFVDYVSNHEKKTPATPIIDYDQFKKVVEEKQQTKREPLITDKQWENFMDTIAFPEKSITALFSSSNNNTSTETKEATTPVTPSTPTNTSATKALEIIENDFEEQVQVEAEAEEEEEEEEEQKDPMRPVIVTMFKKTRFDTLGFRPQHLYGRTGIYIAEIVDNSKAANTKLRTGMKILTINGKPCPDTEKKTIDKLSQLTGYVSIKAVPEAPHSEVSSTMDDIAFAMKYLFTGGGNVVDDSTKGGASTMSYFGGDESTLDISTVLDTVADDDDDDEAEYDDDTAASSVAPASPAAPIKSKNVAPAPVPQKKKEVATTRSKKSRGTTTNNDTEVDYVELARQPETRYELVFDIKKRRGEWVGLSLMRNNDWPGVYIEQVDPRSKFAKTQLTQGMKLVEINGKPCPDDLRKAIYLIFDTDGTLELTVEDSDGLYCHEDGSMVDTLSHDDFRMNYGGFLVQNLRLDG